MKLSGPDSLHIRRDLIRDCPKMQHEHYRHFSEMIAVTVTSNLGCGKISWKSEARHDVP